MKFVYSIFLFQLLFSFIRDPLPGDLNDDGSVDVLDIVTMVSWILDEYQPTPDEFEVADLNVDGSIDILDIVRLVEIILTGPSLLDISLNPLMSNFDEGYNLFPEWISEVVVETGDLDNLGLFYNSSPDSVSFSIEEGFVLLNYLHPDFNGMAEYGVIASNDAGEIDTAYASINVNPIADVDMNIRALNRFGSPIMDDITSTITINGVEYTTTDGHLRLQLPAGAYDLFAENDSTGVFHPDAGRIDPIILIAEQGYVPIQDDLLAFQDAEELGAIVNVGTSDMNLDFFKMKTWLWDDYVKAFFIYDNSAPSGIDRVNTLTPQVYADTTMTDFAYADPITYANAQWVVDAFFPELAIMSEVPLYPQWVGYSTPPEADPNGETVDRINFLSTENQPGHHGELVNENNVIYEGAVYSPTENSKSNLAGEMFQAYAGARNDPPGGGGINGHILTVDGEGNPHPNQFCSDMTKFWGYTGNGFKLVTGAQQVGESYNKETKTTTIEVEVEDVFGFNHTFEYEVKN